MIDLSSYFDLPDDDEITRRITLKPEPLADLTKYETQEACKLIERTLKQMLIPTSQILALIRSIVSMARAHIATTYTDEDAFRDKCYREDVRPEYPWYATALTGLGGVGKT